MSIVLPSHRPIVPFNSWDRVTKVAAVAIIAALILLLVGPRMWRTINPPVIDAEKSIVLLKVKWSGTVTYRTKLGTKRQLSSAVSKGSGFFVSKDGDIMSAAHMVDEQGVANAIIAELAQSDTIDAATQDAIYYTGTVSNISRVISASQPEDVDGAVLDPEGVAAEVVSVRTDADLMLLKLNDLKVSTPWLKLASANPAIESRAVASGYAGSVGRFTDETRRRISFKDGQVSSRQISLQGASFTELSTPMTQGMSGGPVLDDRNHVLGVVSWGADQQAFNFMTDTENTRTFLEASGVLHYVSPWTITSLVMGSFSTLVWSLTVIAVWLRKRRTAPNIVA